ncbi:MAG: glycosyltransferase family 2 protein [Verrucomicrobiota bacterium]
MRVDISIIVPVFNEAENILPLTQEVALALRSERRTYELVFVDDASTDETWERINAAHQANSSVRGLRHGSNRGQSAALWSGIQATTGPVIATMDGDLQNDPADLPKLLTELDWADFILGRRVKRRDNWLRQVSSRVARQARKIVLGIDLQDTGCSLRVFKRSALDGIFPFNGLHRFLPVLVHGGGAKVLEIPVNHRPRAAGVSKYGIRNRLGRGIVDLLAVAWYQKRRLRNVQITETNCSSGT